MKSSATVFIGKKIKQARKEAGVSQKELAHYLNVSDKAISTYEVGRAHPSFEMIQKISKVVHKPVSYFDDSSSGEELDLELKINKVERELAEIKELLRKRKP